MNLKYSKISNPHWLVLYLSDSMKFKRIDKYVALSNLSIYYTLENYKNVM